MLVGGDAAAAAEIAANMTHAFYSRPAICPYMGTLDEGITFSLHGLLFADELAGLLRRMWRGIEVSAEGYASAVAPHVVVSLDPDPEALVQRLFPGAVVAGIVVDAETSEAHSNHHHAAG